MPKSVLRYELDKVRYLNLESYLILVFFPNNETHLKKEEKGKWYKFLHGIWRVCEILIFFIFKILLMLMECSILLMGKTVEMARGWGVTFMPASR